MIIIDPGHGGTNPGAIGPAGTREADVNLTLAYYLQTFLDGHSMLTREDDEYVSLHTRAAMGDDADAFISLHCNAAEHERAQGFEIWTSPGVTGADSLASMIFKAVVRVSAHSRRFRSDWADHDEDKEARFSVLVNTRCPAVLIETAFISNPDEEQQLRDDNFLRLQACAISSGIKQWTGGYV